MAGEAGVATAFPIPAASGFLAGVGAKPCIVAGFSADWSTSAHFRLRDGGVTGTVIASVSAAADGGMGEFAIRAFARGGVYVEVLDDGGATLLGSVHII